MLGPWGTPVDVWAFGCLVCIIRRPFLRNLLKFHRFTSYYVALLCSPVFTQLFPQTIFILRK
jgi:hypothetical protein